MEVSCDWATAFDLAASSWESAYTLIFLTLTAGVLSFSVASMIAAKASAAGSSDHNSKSSSLFFCVDGFRIEGLGSVLFAEKKRLVVLCS